MIFWLALAALGAPQVPVRGIVTDPDARAVAGAHIELTCGTARASGASDAGGTFSIDPPGVAPCLLRVRRDGFAEYTRLLNPPLATAPIRIRLVLSRREEQVDVRAVRPGPARAAAGIADAADLTAERLGIAGPDMTRWLALAARAAGQSPGSRSLTVNGLDSAVPPPADEVTSVRVANDPFSAEFSGADRVRIEITAEPGRRWTMAVSPGVFEAGRRDLLLPAASTTSQSRTLSAGGPLSKSGRLRVFASASEIRNDSHPTYLNATGDALASTVASSSETHGWTTGAAGWLGTLAVQAAFSASGTRIANGGVGGRSDPAGAMNLDTAARRFQTTWRRTGTEWSIRGGLSVDHQRSDTIAASVGPGRVLAGRLIAGAPDALSLSQRATSWRVRTVMESAHDTPARWLFGVDASLDDLSGSRAPNPDGFLVVTDPNATGGVWFNRAAPVAAAVRTRAAALFGQRTLVTTDRVWLRLGARADWQHDQGVALSPRLSAGVALAGFLVGANLGVFSDPWSAAAELERRYRVAPPPLTVSADGQIWPVTFTGQPQRRSDTVLRASIIRPVGRAIVAAEETWTRGRHLAGLTRSATLSALVDTLDSSRSMSRWLTHLRIDMPFGSWTTTAHYEFADAHDNTDGIFTWPEAQTDLAAEWGPSSGLPRHAFTALTSGALGHGVQFLLSARAASGTPFSLVTGLDPGGVFTFTGRVSRARNQQRLPSTSDLSVYCSRPFLLPFGGLTIDTGVRLENLLGTVTPLEVERLASSPFAGRPVSAAPGRTFSVWVTIGRK